MFHIVIFTALVMTVAERLPRLARRRISLLRPHAFTDLAFLLVSWVALARLTLSWVAWATDALGRSVLGQLPLWIESLVALVLLDLGNYLAHWLMHRYEPLWHVHAVHHSSPALDWLSIQGYIAINLTEIARSPGPTQVRRPAASQREAVHHSLSSRLCELGAICLCARLGAQESVRVGPDQLLPV